MQLIYICLMQSSRKVAVKCTTNTNSTAQRPEIATQIAIRQSNSTVTKIKIWGEWFNNSQPNNHQVPSLTQGISLLPAPWRLKNRRTECYANQIQTNTERNTKIDTQSTNKLSKSRQKRPNDLNKNKSIKRNKTWRFSFL